MKKLSKEILDRDAERDIGAEVLEAIREIKAGGGRKFNVHVSEAIEARLKLGVSQKEFAAMLGYPRVPCRIGSKADASRAGRPRRYWWSLLHRRRWCETH